VEASSGPGLVFETLPNIFNALPGGQIWGSLFFVFMSFAALSTVFAVFENIVACVRDVTGWERKKACLITGASLCLLTMPCVLGFTVWSNVSILGLSIMDFEDFMVSNIILPSGSLLFALFCVTRYGWGWNKFVAEANEGTGLKVAKWMRPYMTFVVPALITFIFVYGLYNFFK
jgi:NSS family neurotransmitter:Na+ symporter